MALALITQPLYMSSFKIMKKVWKIIKIFILLIIIVVISEVILKWVYTPAISDNTKSSFLKTPEKTYDILYIGNCHCYSTFMPSLIEEKTNLSGYVFAAGNLDAMGSYYLLKTALNYQTPKYVVFETFPYVIFDSYVDQDLMKAYKCSLSIDLPYKERILYSLDAKKYGDNYWKNYLFGILYFHEGWLNNENIPVKKVSEDNGFLEYWNDEPLDNPSDILSIDIKSDKKLNLSDEYKEYFDKIIKLAKENDITLIFAQVPYVGITENEVKRYNYLKDEIRKNGYKYIDFTSDEMLQKLNFTRNCMKDINHVNKKGATIISNYMADFINENYKQ